MTRMTRGFQPFYKEIYLVRGEWFFLRKSWNTRDTRVMVRMVGLSQLSDSQQILMANWRWCVVTHSNP